VADVDLLIAAVALAKGASLITGNVKQDERIPGLLIEEWIRST
jgi:tRNA(fMet)-specific endonuclease VapC